MNSLYLRQPGDLIAHYRVRRLIGSGMEGNVYAVTDTRDGSVKSLKILRGRRMLREAEHIAAHYLKLRGIPSVKQLRDRGVLAGQRGVGIRPWLAFDYVDGTTLADLSARGLLWRPIEVLVAICASLEAVHERGVAIGDLDNGRNILQERGSGRIVICDLDAGEIGEKRISRREDLKELITLTRGVLFARTRSMLAAQALYCLETSRSIGAARKRIVALAHATGRARGTPP